ncbi:ubiquitin carboxyl-terminal hydrolase 26 [Peromyscus californicus insignis]|uniref:ubiquitin carboxyl-terminal hydrolase 26 n=1 Tax=Peromyscus californicus insignis TaxID=564181 RepID=UPI0022A7AA72|nr:ubiquitin carboxyl-terminal hydrolase 26 [Peromyscus californicus insignis]
MDPVLIHAQVQMWSAKAGMSKSRTAFIETVVGKREVKLLLYFITGRIKALQLKNNIKSVVLKTYDEDQNYLHLTFKNNDFLFVEKLTSTDARQLKRFLDRVYERNLRTSRRSRGERADGPSTSAHSLPLKVRSEASSKCFGLGEESGAPGLCESPLFSSSLTALDNGGLLENPLVKRKRSSPDSENNGKENFLEESNNEIEAKSVVSVHDDRGKGRDLREAGQSQLGLGFSSETDYPEEPDLDVCDLYDLIKKLFSPFLLRSYCLEKGMEWHEHMKTLLLYPEKAWQGLPNVGNTCYINVVLQSLCSIPVFVNDLFNQGFPWIKPPRDDFNMPLMQLLVLKDIYSMKTREKLLIKITKALPQFGEVFTADRQSDAHEFLSLCLVQLKETVQKLTILWQSENESGGNNLLTQIFADHAITNKIPVCPVANNFEFELLRSIFCKGCGLAVLRKEPSSYLSINIPQGLKGHNLSIQSSFDLFFKAEELDHRCERCMHNKSIALHKFSQLPRVIIIHLKRYSFNESWVMKKDEQNIIISKFLKLSCHCNKNTKPPQPLHENELVKDLDLLKPLHELGSEIFKSSFNSMMTSQFKDFPTASVRSTKESEPQNIKDSEVLNGEVQQEGQGKGATASVIRSELTNETEKLKNPEKARKFSKLDSGSISKERPPKYQQAQKCYKERSDKRTSREAVTQRRKPRSLEQTENLRKPAESQNGSLNSQGSLGSSKKPGNKDVLDKKTKPTGKVDPQKATGSEGNGYRLINIISHIGSSLHGGHYINDTFDFRKRVWFTYSDPQVTSTQEDFVLKARLSTGYVFFYMQNEIFEELLAKETQSRNTSQ